MYVIMYVINDRRNKHCRCRKIFVRFLLDYGVFPLRRGNEQEKANQSAHFIQNWRACYFFVFLTFTRNYLICHFLILHSWARYIVIKKWQVLYFFIQKVVSLLLFHSKVSTLSFSFETVYFDYFWFETVTLATFEWKNNELDSFQ